MTTLYSTKVASGPRRQSGSEQPAPSPYRRDIQGLRAVAVLLVALDHAGVGWLSGGYVGVDVFFVVSGFVITMSLLGRRGTSLADFYAARARRILPMATIVLVATVVAASHLLNFVRAGRIATDALWAGFFAANVRFSTLGTDYFATGQPQSPLQHYWSLAVEEQFYLAWPLMLVVLLAVPGRRVVGRPHRGTGAVVAFLFLVVAVSLFWCIRRTGQLPTAAFFSTFARAWELAVGALLAVGAGTVARLPASVRVVLGWLGLAGVLAAGALLTADTPFPGSAALLPVLSTAAIIAGGTGPSRGGAGSVLDRRPMQAVGNWSYSFYLWHWPVLLLAAGYAERDLPLRLDLLLLIGALALSAGTYRLVENPIRRSSRLRADQGSSLLLWPAALVGVLVISIWSSSGLRAEADRRAAAAEPETSVAVGGLPAPPAVTEVPVPEKEVGLAVTAAKDGKPIPAALTPPVGKIATDFDYRVCFADKGETTSEVCRYGDVAATRSIAIIGDSHAMMWVPALDLIGKTHGWAVRPLLKPTCTSAEVTMYVPGQGPDRDCDQWRSWALKTALSMRFERILLANYPPAHLADGEGNRITDMDAATRRWREGVAETARTLSGGGAAVTFLGDAPGLQQDPTECLLRRSATMTSCTWNVSPYIAARNSATREGARRSGATYLDVEDWFCADGRCPTVIGSRVAYQDSNHVSRTYALHLAEPLAGRLRLRR